MPPKISILTPSFNCAQYIERCINSVLRQDYPNLEHIVVDGASTDNTIAILKAHPHIRWISEPDRGEGEALNKALKMATGDLVCWLNADDWMAAGAFSVVLNAFGATNGNSIIYGNTEMVNETGRLLSVKKSAPGADLATLIRWWLTQEHPHQSSMYFPLHIMRTIGAFADSLHFSIDYEYWLRCATQFSFVHVDQVLSCACQRADCKSANTEPGQIQSHWNVLMPYLLSLPIEQRVIYWGEYFLNRLQYPNANEQTRVPKEQESALGLKMLLQASLLSDELLSLLFPDQAVKEAVSGLLTSAQQPPSTAPPPASSRRTGPRIAGRDNVSSKDLTQVDEESDFSKTIKRVFAEIRPTKIIETGTYLGTGTTSIIAGAIRDLAIKNSKFFTIEVNPNNAAQASRNLSERGLTPFVTLLQGLSLPRHLLPSESEIHEKLVTGLSEEDIFVDHAEGDRAKLYFNETQFGGCPENLLEECLVRFDYKPDFVLLDSAGHIGQLEFNYLISKLKGPCVVALDDIKHVKHYHSFQQILNDSRFKVIHTSEEKFGFCVASFEPEKTPAVRTKSSANKVLWVRADSIGDGVLSVGMIPHIRTWAGDADVVVVCQDHIARVYEGVAGVTEIIPFSRASLEGQEEYRQEFLRRIQSVGATHAINSASSRDLLSDFITLQANAKHMIGWDSTSENMSAEVLTKHNSLYTQLLALPSAALSELDRNDAFLAALGIRAEKLGPVFTPTVAEVAWAKEYLISHGCIPEKTITVFFGANWGLRNYHRYGEALKKLAQNSDYTFIALGSAGCAEINLENLLHSNARFFDLSGQTTLGQAAALIQASTLAAGAETGLAHIACAVGKRNVVLLGGGHFGRFMPYTPITTVAALPLDCFGCNWKCKFSAPHCVRDLDSDVFYNALVRALAPVAPLRQQIIVQKQGTWPTFEGLLPRWNIGSAQLKIPQGEFISADQITRRNVQ